MPKVKYLLHPQLELLQCAEGVLTVYIFGNRISFFEESIDSNFSSFILRYKNNKPFCVEDMKKFFSNKGYNFGKIIRKMEKNGLIVEADNKKTQSLVLVNLTDFSDEKILKLSEEVNMELILVNDLNSENNNKQLYEKLDQIRNNQMIFVMSDFEHKYKVSELNLYFFNKGIYWCPIIIDEFGGYIGPLIQSVPSGPCFNCYDRKVYKNNESINTNECLHRFMQNIFLQIAFIEMYKVSTKYIPSQIIYSNLLEIDCFNHRSRKHYIYTDSHCTVCGL